jgi:DNA-binding MarR family transcriptional regulator
MSYLSAEGSLTAGELAVRMDLAASSMTSVLDRLEKAGVARREPHPVDRRAVAVVITEQGHQALRWSRHWLGAALLDLSPDDVATTTDVLSRLADSLRRQTATIERATSSGTSEPDE